MARRAMMLRSNSAVGWATFFTSGAAKKEEWRRILQLTECAEVSKAHGQYCQALGYAANRHPSRKRCVPALRRTLMHAA